MPTAPPQLDLSGHRHAVTLYEDDGELVGIVAGHLLSGLSIGGSAFAVATAPHVDAVSVWLARHGVEVAARQRDGTLVFLDAAATLDRLFVDGRLDASRFEDEVGGVVFSTGRPIHVFGEMVDLLWAQGRVPDVLALEQLWVGLCGRHQISLLCGYSAQSAVDDVLFADVLRLHDPPLHEELSATKAFPANPESAAGARRFVRSVLHRWGQHQLVGDGELVVSELASNAVLHAGSNFAVTLERQGTAVRIAVTDSAPQVPVLAAGDSAGRPSHAHGLAIVASVAWSWGTDLKPDGKVVWAELAGA